MASCRACGGELRQIALCPTCEESVQWKCVSCSKDTDVSIHTHGGVIIRPRDIDRVGKEAALTAA